MSPSYSWSVRLILSQERSVRITLEMPFCRGSQAQSRHITANDAGQKCPTRERSPPSPPFNCFHSREVDDMALCRHKEIRGHVENNTYTLPSAMRPEHSFRLLSHSGGDFLGML